LKKSDMKNRKQAAIHYRGIGILFIIATALLLTIIQPPFKSSFFAWIAYVPLIYVAIRSENKLGLYFFSYLVAFVYWLGNIYWMGYVTVSGWIAFSAYTALLWPVLVVMLRWCNQKKIPLFLSAAIVIVGIERLQGLFLGGFYWRHLSHSQYENIILIQIADVFGAAGISFLIAMFNGLIAELFLLTRIKDVFSRRISRDIFCSFLALLVVIFYGHQRLSQMADVTKPGPIVAAVQSNLPQDVKNTDSFEISQKNFQEHLALSRQCADAGALLIAWPETIIPAIMDKAAWPFLLADDGPVYFHKKLCEHSSEGVYLLVGAPGAYIDYSDDYQFQYDRFNSAFLYEPTGDQSIDNYDKIHLVPFGEVVPFEQSMPWVYDFLMKFSPYDFDYNLTPGDEFTVFEIKEAAENKEYRFGVMICYEGTIPKIARSFALDDAGRKQVDWLVNISNDGWFVRFDDEQVIPSTELVQHTISCVFRAVENRLAIIRSVNTGISCLIDPLGRIKAGYIAGDLPTEALDRKGMQGFFADSVPIDSRVTFFSRYGQWLDNACGIIVFSVLILRIINPVVRNTNKRAKANDKQKKPKNRRN